MKWIKAENNILVNINQLKKIFIQECKIESLYETEHPEELKGKKTKKKKEKTIHYSYTTVFKVIGWLGLDKNTYDYKEDSYLATAAYYLGDYIDLRSFLTYCEANDFINKILEIIE